MHNQFGGILMNHRILVIDDEKNIRMTLEKCLSYEGYTVDTAEDGKSGIEKFKKVQH
jgi:DNA-binding response OmpR family regulator